MICIKTEHISERVRIHFTQKMTFLYSDMMIFYCNKFIIKCEKNIEILDMYLTETAENRLLFSGFYFSRRALARPGVYFFSWGIGKE